MHGQTYRGRPCGSFGDISTFSFYPNKHVTTGEGGMLVTDDDELLARISMQRDHGRAQGDVSFFNREIGQKYKMSAMQAALGLAQLERLDELVARKREIFGWYRARLAGVPGLALNPEPPDVVSTYWMVTVVPDRSLGVSKRELIDRLDARAIDARPFFYPLSSLPAYASRPAAAGAAERNPTAYRLSETGVNLPSGLNLTEELVDRVCRSLIESLG
jgi:perosamine synthetase